MQADIPRFKCPIHHQVHMQQRRQPARTLLIRLVPAANISHKNRRSTPEQCVAPLRQHQNPVCLKPIGWGCAASLNKKVEETLENCNKSESAIVCVDRQHHGVCVLCAPTASSRVPIYTRLLDDLTVGPGGVTAAIQLKSCFSIQLMPTCDV